MLYVKNVICHSVKNKIIEFVILNSDISQVSKELHATEAWIWFFFKVRNENPWKNNAKNQRKDITENNKNSSLVLHKKSKNPGIPVVLQFDNEKS